MPNYKFTSSSPVYSFGHPWTPAVKRLIIINTVIFLLSWVFAKGGLTTWLGLQSPELFTHSRLWQPLTYFFFHHDFWHLAFNMLALWMFGCDVEKSFGTKNFLTYYMVSGILTGFIVGFIAKIAGEHSITTGASGAIFAILLAYGILFAERTITLLLFLIIPVSMKAKMMILIFAAIEFVAGVGNAFGKVSHLAHLSGIIIGYLYFLIFYPKSVPQLDILKPLRHLNLLQKTNSNNSEHQVDIILEKISRSGINSLSKKERSILSEAAKQRRTGTSDKN